MHSDFSRVADRFRFVSRRNSTLSPRIESLEARALFSVTASAPIQAQALSINASRTIDLFPNFTDPTANSMVNVVTDEGSFQIELFNKEAPRTVANFVQYVDSGEYNGTIVSRSVPGFVVQAGGYTPDFTQVPQNPPRDQ